VITDVRPGLVPLTFDAAHRELQALSGLSLPVTARCGRASFDEAMLITHRGLSGPAILQISNYWREGEPIEIDLLPDPAAVESVLAARATGRRHHDVLAAHIPRRFADAWCARHPPSKPIV